jgi:hypothetical protein
MWTAIVVAVCFIISLCFFIYELLKLIKHVKKPASFSKCNVVRSTRDDIEFELQEIKSRLSEIQESIRAQRESFRNRRYRRKNG